MKLSEELTWRGFVGKNTFDDLGELDRGDKTFYWGVDPSSDSMTIGNLAAAMLAIHFIRAGHKGILLAGGATGQVGDPKDDAERALKTLDEIAKNKAGIKSQFETIFRDEKFTLVDNYDWFKEMHYLDFLRDIGKHFSMTQLLDREFVKSRIGADGDGLSYAEFSYSLIQGYDFLHLFREYGVTLQLCGEDQFGNSVSGMQLIRKLENAKADVFGMPLIVNKSTGKKFGKSEGGAIWLSAAKTSPFQFYQFWLNVDDAGVIDYLKIYTFLSREEIEEIAKDHFAKPELRAAQKVLAHEVTVLVHGEMAAKNVEHVSRILFGENDFREISDDELEILAREIPTIDLRENLTAVDALTEAKTANSRGEAMRLIQQNAVAMNGKKIAGDETIREKSLLKKGKNQFVLVK